MKIIRISAELLPTAIETFEAIKEVIKGVLLENAMPMGIPTGNGTNNGTISMNTSTTNTTTAILPNFNNFTTPKIEIPTTTTTPSTTAEPRTKLGTTLTGLAIITNNATKMMKMDENDFIFVTTIKEVKF